MSGRKRRRVSLNSPNNDSQNAQNKTDGKNRSQIKENSQANKPKATRRRRRKSSGHSNNEEKKNYDYEKNFEILPDGTAALTPLAECGSPRAHLLQSSFSDYDIEDLKKARRKIFFLAFIAAIASIATAALIFYIVSNNIIYSYKYDYDRTVYLADLHAESESKHYFEKLDRIDRQHEEIHSNPENAKIEQLLEALQSYESFYQTACNDTKLSNNITGDPSPSLVELRERSEEEINFYREAIQNMLKNTGSKVEYDKNLFDGDNVKADAQLEESKVYKEKLDMLDQSYYDSAAAKTSGFQMDDETYKAIVSNLDDKYSHIQALYKEAIARETQAAKEKEIEDKYSKEFEAKKDQVAKEASEKTRNELNTQHQSEIDSLNGEISSLKSQLDASKANEKALQDRVEKLQKEKEALEKLNAVANIAKQNTAAGQ